METTNNSFENSFLNRHFNWIAFGLIAALVLISYSNTFTASFHFDDDQAIAENPIIKQPTADNVFQIIKGARPMVFLSLMLNYQLGGLNPVGWHIFNISVHALNSFFVYLLILWTLSMPSLRAEYGEKAKRISLFGAVLFGVHPIQTESVTYIISRTELISTCFYLATFLILIKGAKKNKFLTLIGILMMSTLAMSSKEWAVTLPALLLLYDFLFIAEGDFGQVLSRWYLYVAAALPWELVLSRLPLFQSGGGASVGFNVKTVSGLTPSSYLFTSVNVIWTYIRLLFIPIGQNIDYDYAVSKSLFEFPTMLSLAGHLAVVALAFWLYRTKKMRLIPFGIAWFYIGLSPTQSFVPVIDVIFEHRVYMPSVGFFLAFVVVFEMIFVWFKKGEEEKPAKRELPGQA